ncbi:tyrosine-protein phosphatase non-receptor type 61F isoform X2 [Drosophila nasuta]|uniref:protein-tyrosine-phosphatase n=1 Tax=Drosophila albomicans TaxID=7291 RepID=A0A6P8WPK1_DROAB|nr:tyrosine-protein phosphatase non-receptor type 61F isoform X2 [Drosophila albomicans]XP_060653319.1 tyrosine-protein phosphatase non-receptor type 61F isoform X2 [Drosophila nasuta]
MSEKATTTAAPTKDNTPARLKIEQEYNDKKTGSGWHRFYKELCEVCDREAKEQQFTTLESERSQNRGLNRYRDVNPYDHSRIILRRGNVDYINANLVKLERADRQYILTQGPLLDTVGHLWLMVWEQNSRAILMLNKLMEKKQVKCHLYWPDQLGPEHALNLRDVNLSVELICCENYQNFVRRWFKLTDLETKTSREVMQFHYTTWPDFGIPSSPDAFLKFLQQVRDSGALNKDVGPAVVHCSAGIGRSGTFCLVDCCLVLVDKYGECNVAKVLCKLRSYRLGLIQTPDQLDFSYQAIIEGIKKLNDPSFLEAEEPILSNDTEPHTQDEQPPPLPPRSHSLNLPLAPNTGGVLSLDMRAAHANGDGIVGESDIILSGGGGEKPTLSSKDALNNIIINQHEIVNAEVADSLLNNRPLPPLPTLPQHSEQESDSDDEDEDYDDNDDDEDDDDEEEYETIDEHKLDTANGDVTLLQPHEDDVNANSEKPTAAVEPHKVNGIDLTTSSGDELKRRKRTEYQANLEQKVNEIKRKQRENEDNQQAAKKRRRPKHRTVPKIK